MISPLAYVQAFFFRVFRGKPPVHFGAVFVRCCFLAVFHYTSSVQNYPLRIQFKLATTIQARSGRNDDAGKVKLLSYQEAKARGRRRSAGGSAATEGRERQSKKLNALVAERVRQERKQK